MEHSGHRRGCPARGRKVAQKSGWWEAGGARLGEVWIDVWMEPK